MRTARLKWLFVTSYLLVIGGRSGVGKSSVGFEIHAQLSAADVQHTLIEGDNLDLAHPTPHLAHTEYDLAGRNLRAMWANYRDLGYTRLIYTNTVSPLVAEHLAEAMGDGPVVTAVLLTADDATARQRLAGREIGSALDWHVRRSAEKARELDAGVTPATHRVATDGRAVADIAAEVIALTNWA